MAVDPKAVFAMRQELDDLLVALARKRSEVSNLTVGYRRAAGGVSPLPAEPLKRKLIAARAELTELEERIAALQAQLPAEN